MKPAARFMTDLDMRRGKGDSRILLAPLIFYSAYLERSIAVPAGFVTNLASVPRLPFAYLLFGGVADEAAVVHDWLYTNNVKGVTRKQADEVFAEASKALGVSGWQRGSMWLGVRLFGGNHWGSGSPLATVEPVIAEDERD